jgi:uncharacterized protein (TIGR03435 family)
MSTPSRPAVRRSRLSWAMLAVMLGSASVVAQSDPAASSPTFDVASIKRTDITGVVRPIMGEVQPGGVWRSTLATPVALIQALYPGYSFPGEIVGGPEWATTEPYDITARAAATASPADMRAMAQALLAARFKLVMHKEMRELPIYRLVTARQDGRPGPGLTTPAIDCEAYRSARQRGEPLPVDPTRKQYADRLPCVTVVMPVFDHTRVIPGAASRLTAGGTTISGILGLLSRELGRRVIDQTGLTQTFDIELQYSDTVPRVNEESGPPLRAAITEQLGLKLEESRMPVEVLVIDRIERPSPD